jgi:hypothetical protein
MKKMSTRRRMLRIVVGPNRGRSPSSPSTWMLTTALPTVLPHFHSVSQK